MRKLGLLLVLALASCSTAGPPSNPFPAALPMADSRVRDW